MLKERPVGSKNNEEVNNLLEELYQSEGFQIISLPFSCGEWESGESYFEYKEGTVAILPSPFSRGVTGEAEVVVANSLEVLKEARCTDKILFLTGKLAECSLQPKNYPFYYPEEDKTYIELLEEKHPLAIVAWTGQHPSCGLNPFPLFEDGNFLIPSAYANQVQVRTLRIKEGDRIKIHIASEVKKRTSRQIIARKEGKASKGTIVVCAHMDTKYGTIGALDNGAGVLALNEIAKQISLAQYTVEIVPFNGEEYYEASGEMAYLKRMEESGEEPVLVINLDAPCHLSSDIAVSCYHCGEMEEKFKEVLGKEVVWGPEWYASDHAAFAMRGIPCVAITSSDLFEGGLEHTHSEKDLWSDVELGQVKTVAKTAVVLMEYMDRKE